MLVLVVAEGRHGTTEEIADVIGDVLTEKGIEVDRRHPESVDSVYGYDAVVVGSAIYLGRWVKPMREFASRHQAGLLAAPVWLFSCGPLDRPPVDQGTPDEAAEVTTRLRARGHALFAGRLDPTELNWGERLAVKAVKAPVGDFRDWAEIKDWAAGVAAAVLSPSKPTS